MLTYHELTVTVTNDSREALTAKMLDMGSMGLVDRPGELLAYFEGSINADGVIRELEAFRDDLARAGLDSGFIVQYAAIPGQDWNEEWKKGFAPRNIGQSFTVVPSWMEHRTDCRVIIIDPGMAFGTGSHETTERCLTFVELLSGSNLGRSFLDIGTGTGILAIGAAKLGYGKITAVDNDPLAVDAARRNARLNGISAIDIREGGIETADGNYDLITANLLSSALIDLAGGIAARLSPGGAAVVSGIAEGQEDGVIRAMERAGLKLKEKAVDGRWVTLVLSLKAGKWGSE